MLRREDKDPAIVTYDTKWHNERLRATERIRGFILDFYDRAKLQDRNTSPCDQLSLETLSWPQGGCVFDSFGLNAYSAGTPFVESLMRSATVQYEGDPYMIHEGVSIQMAALYLQPGEELGMEQHTEGEQVLYVIRGTAIVHISNPRDDSPHITTETLFYCSPGRAVIIPRGTAHNVLNVSEEECVHAWHFYAPLVHPGTAGHTYARRYSRASPAEEFHLVTESTPEGRGAICESTLMSAITNTAVSQGHNRLVEITDNVQMGVLVAHVGCVVGVVHEGYYYVVVGRGDVYNYGASYRMYTSSATCTDIDTKQSFGIADSIQSITCGGVFYVGCQSAAVVINTDDSEPLCLVYFATPIASTKFARTRMSEWNFDRLIASDAEYVRRKIAESSDYPTNFYNMRNINAHPLVVPEGRLNSQIRPCDIQELDAFDDFFPLL